MRTCACARACACARMCVHNGWLTGSEYRELHWGRRSGTVRARCGGVDAWNFLCALIVVVRSSVCFCGVMLGYGDTFIFTLDLVSHVTTACHCAVIPAEEHLDSLLKSLVKEPLGNLNTDESLNDASSTRGASSKTDGEFSLRLICWYIQCCKNRLYCITGCYFQWHCLVRNGCK